MFFCGGQSRSTLWFAAELGGQGFAGERREAYNFRSWGKSVEWGGKRVGEGL